MRRIFAVVVVLAAVFLLQGCGSPWKVVKQASPNPFVGNPTLTLENTSFEGLMVKDRSEGDFKAERTAEENQRWDEDKRKVADAFSTALFENASTQWQRGAAPEAFHVRPHITNMHGGISMGIGSTPSHLEMTVQIVKDNVVLDEIRTEAEYSQGESGSIGGVALGGYTGSARLTKAAEKLGKNVADYLDHRIKH